MFYGIIFLEGAREYHLRRNRTDAGASSDDVVRVITERTRQRIEDLVPGAIYTFVLFTLGVDGAKNFDASPEVVQQTSKYSNLEKNIAL